MTVRFVSITFPGADADADCFAMCAACARGDSFLRSRQAGRQAEAEAEAQQGLALVSGAGATPHYTHSLPASFRFVLFGFL